MDEDATTAVPRLHSGDDLQRHLPGPLAGTGRSSTDDHGPGHYSTVLCKQHNSRCVFERFVVVVVTVVVVVVVVVV